MKTPHLALLLRVPSVLANAQIAGDALLASEMIVGVVVGVRGF